MPLQPKTDRFQMRFLSFEEHISPDNSVRFIDAFVDKLGLNKLGFAAQTIKTEGRPAFEQSAFLKLYLYGYLNGLRSSRKLERECVRNIELHWLLRGQQPNYYSRLDKLRGLEKVNGEFALIMTVYNLKRSLNILGMPKLIEKLNN